MQCRVFHEGKMIKKEKASYIDFMAGLSGQCVHVQVLGCKNIMAADYGGASDPYVVAVFQGKSLGMTRVRPRTLNPRWVNETFICPLADGLPDARNMPRSQKVCNHSTAYCVLNLPAHMPSHSQNTLTMTIPNIL